MEAVAEGIRDICGEPGCGSSLDPHYGFACIYWRCEFGVRTCQRRGGTPEECSAKVTKEILKHQETCPCKVSGERHFHNASCEEEPEMVSEYVVGQWLFVRTGTMDCYGMFVHAKEHQVVIDVHYAGPTPGGFLPARRLEYPGDEPHRWKNPPVRVDFGRAVSLIATIEPPLTMPA